MADKSKVLYIDDELLNLKVFSINFEQDYEIFTAEDGTLGLDVLEKHPEIETIISDLRMRRMNGDEFVKRAKNIYPKKRFALLSAYTLTEEIQELLDNQIIDKFMSKPFNQAEVRDFIND